MTTKPHDDDVPIPLSDWNVNPSRNPEFRANVWARIESASRPANWARFAVMHPAIVAGALAAALVAGAWTGAAEARNRTAADRAVIAANYVHSLDARWMRQR